MVALGHRGSHFAVDMGPLQTPLVLGATSRGQQCDQKHHEDSAVFMKGCFRKRRLLLWCTIKPCSFFENIKFSVPFENWPFSWHSQTSNYHWKPTTCNERCQKPLCDCILASKWRNTSNCARSKQVWGGPGCWVGWWMQAMEVAWSCGKQFLSVSS